VQRGGIPQYLIGSGRVQDRIVGQTRTRSGPLPVKSRLQNWASFVADPPQCPCTAKPKKYHPPYFPIYNHLAT
jgi:hypothetical protein